MKMLSLSNGHFLEGQYHLGLASNNLNNVLVSLPKTMSLS